MKKIQILATTDLHGYVFPFDYSTRNLAAVGLAKLKPLMDQYRDENTLLIDNGDNLEGNPLTFYHHTFHHDEVVPITNALNHMGYDYFSIGNHDFNYGTEILKRHLDNMKATCITGNASVDGKALAPAYTIHTFDNGVNLALIGVCTDYITHWEKPENLVGVDVCDVFSFVKETVALIKKYEDVDGIVVVYHGGLEKDWNTGKPTEDLTGENVGYKMCAEIDGIDLLISGHQHRSFVCKVKDTVVTQTYCNAREFARIVWDVENKKIDAEIVKGTDDYDEGFLVPYQKEEAEVQAWLDTPLGHFDEGDCVVSDQLDARVHKHRCVSFLNQVQLESSGADLSAQALFNDATGFKHDISMRDLLATYMFPNTLVVKKVTGKVLKQFLEKSAEYFDIVEGEIGVNWKFSDPKPQHYNYDMVDPLEYTITVSKPYGQRVSNIRFKDVEVKDEDEFTFATSNYRASGGGDYDMIATCPVVKAYQEDMVSLIRDYILERKVITVKHNEDIKVIK